MNKLFLCILLSGFVGAATVPGRADVLIVQNGDRLTGTIESLEGGTVHLKTAYASIVKIPAGKIKAMSTDDVVTVRYAAGGYITGRLINAGPDAVKIVGVRGGRSGPVNLADIAEIHPGTSIRRGFKWSGRINVGATARSGNTDTRSININTAVKARSEKNRLRLEGQYNREFDGSKKTVDDFAAFAQHDRFVSDKLYFYTNVKLERDKPKDLILRTTVGTGGGWQVIESKRTNLSMEAGPSYAREDHAVGEDRGFIAGRWAVNFDCFIRDEYVQFFHSQEGTVDLEDAGNIFIDSSTGFRFPIRNSFNMTAQIDVDWDSNPEPGVTTTDKTYLMTVGYNW